MNSEVRAGIVVTGTEVLSGVVTDRNGPWLSERLAERGVEVAHILVVGDRPDDLEAALGFLASTGVDLIVTSGGLGPTADDLTAEVVGRFSGREMVLDEGMEERIAEILRGFARRFRFDQDAVREANRKQAVVPAGSRDDRSGRHRARARRTGGRAARDRAAGAAARAAADVAVRSGDSRGARAARAGHRALRLHAAHDRHPGVRDRAVPARDRDRRRRSERGRDHHLPAARRDRGRRALARGWRRRGGGGASAA